MKFCIYIFNFIEITKFRFCIRISPKVIRSASINTDHVSCLLCFVKNLIIQGKSASYKIKFLHVISVILSGFSLYKNHPFYFPQHVRKTICRLQSYHGKVAFKMNTLRALLLRTKIKDF